VCVWLAAGAGWRDYCGAYDRHAALKSWRSAVCSACLVWTVSHHLSFGIIIFMIVRYAISADKEETEVHRRQANYLLDENSRLA